MLTRKSLRHHRLAAPRDGRPRAAAPVRPRALRGGAKRAHHGARRQIRAARPGTRCAGGPPSGWVGWENAKENWNKLLSVEKDHRIGFLMWKCVFSLSCHQHVLILAWVKFVSSNICITFQGSRFTLPTGTEYWDQSPWYRYWMMLAHVGRYPFLWVIITNKPETLLLRTQCIPFWGSQTCVPAWFLSTGRYHDLEDHPTNRKWLIILVRKFPFLAGYPVFFSLVIWYYI